jgi:hypothetical protein
VFRAGCLVYEARITILEKSGASPGFFEKEGVSYQLRAMWLDGHVDRGACLGPAGIFDYYILRKSELEHIHEYTTP